MYRQYEVADHQGGRRWLAWFEESPAVAPGATVSIVSPERRTVYLVRAYRKAYPAPRGDAPLYRVDG